MFRRAAGRVKDDTRRSLHKRWSMATLLLPSGAVATSVSCANVTVGSASFLGRWISALLTQGPIIAAVVDVTGLIIYVSVAGLLLRGALLP